MNKGHFFNYITFSENATKFELIARVKQHNLMNWINSFMNMVMKLFIYNFQYSPIELISAHVQCYDMYRIQLMCITKLST